MTQCARWAAVAVAALVVVGCGDRNFVKSDTYILDCDMLTQELARIRHGMTKDEVTKILGTESWVIYGMVDSESVYRQIVVYNYNENCEKLRGKDPTETRRRVLIEYANHELDRITDTPVQEPKKRGLFGT